MELINKISARLLKNTFFREFTVRKRDYSIYRKQNDSFESVELRYWESHDLFRNAPALVIKPLYLKRFNILHEWFEVYSFKSISDQRDAYSIGFDGMQLIGIDKYFFLNSLKDFEKDFSKFEIDLVSNAQNVFKRFSDLSELYSYVILPIISGGAELPNVGADWMFEYLALTKVVDKSQFTRIRKIIHCHAKKMYEAGEPNVIEYYKRFDEIVDHLWDLDQIN